MSNNLVSFNRRFCGHTSYVTATDHTSVEPKLNKIKFNFVDYTSNQLPCRTNFAWIHSV